MMSMKQNCSEHQIFELLTNYEQICSDQVMLLSKLVTRIASGSVKYVHAEIKLYEVRILFYFKLD